MGLWLLTAALAAPCPHPGDPLGRASDAAVEGRFDDVQTELASAEASFGCHPGDGSTLAAFWLTEGMTLMVQGDTENATVSFAAAKRVAPETFVNAFGSKARASWEAAGPEGPQGHLTLSPHPVVASGLLDGKEVTWPQTLDPGVYLVQLARDDQVVFGQLVAVTSGDLTRIETGQAAYSAPKISDAPVPPPTAPAPVRNDPPELLALGMGALALGGASLGMWAVADGQMRKAPSVEKTHRAQERRMAFGAAGLTLIGVGALGITGELVF